MTPEQKKNIKETMIEILIKSGYPNISNNNIMKLVPRMWLDLDRKQLIPKGMTYQHFYRIAMEQKLLSEIAYGRQ